jgi:ComEC/Rec2-related protein
MTRAPLWRQRLPFVGLLGAAVVGIVSAGLMPIESGYWVGAFGLLMVWWLINRQARWVYLAVALGFGALQIWQGKEAPSAELAASISAQEPLTTAVGLVKGDPVTNDQKKTRFTLALESLEIDGRVMRSGCDVMVYVKGDAPRCGDRVSVTGNLREIPPLRNPSQFDARRILALQGITCEIIVRSQRDVLVVRERAGFELLRIAGDCRRWMEKTLRQGISEESLICNLLDGMVLGATSDIPDELQDQFRETGTYHLFSVSGLHVGMIAVILWQALRVAGIGRRQAVLVIIPALFFYALVTGWKPSSVRAAAMSAIFLAGMMSWRHPIAINSLCAAGFLILAQSTNEIFNSGFQLSFVVVGAILLISSPLRDWLRKFVQPDAFIPVALWTRWQKGKKVCGESLADALAVSLAAWVGALPLSIYYFHMVSLSSLLANLAIIPLAFGIMVTAALALAGGIFSSAVAAVFNNANLAFTKMLLVIVQGAAALPWSSVLIGTEWTKETEITVFDFGAGGASAIASGGRIWLLDCGSKRNVHAVIEPWLKARGKSAPEGLLLTHGDAKHIGGALDLVKNGHPQVIIDSPVEDRSATRRQFLKIIKEHSCERRIQQAGDEIPLEKGAKIEILHPPVGFKGNLADDKVMVVRFEEKGRHVLFLSDAGVETCRWMQENCPSRLAAEVLVIGRHKNGLLPEADFLQLVKPEVLIASATDFPETEKMDEVWAEMVENMGIQLLRQDETGAVIIRFAKDELETESFVKKGKANSLLGFKH